MTRAAPHAILRPLPAAASFHLVGVACDARCGSFGHLVTERGDHPFQRLARLIVRKLFSPMHDPGRAHQMALLTNLLT
jgi:hypothetical protein